MRKYAIMTACALTAAACATAANPKNDTPALITDTGPAIISRLESVISGALNGRKVLLADDSFTAKPYVIIDPKFTGDRSAKRGDKFRMVINGGRCLLVHETTGRRYGLDGMTCAPAG